MRVDDGRNSWNLLGIRTKSRTVVETGERSPLINSDPGSELRLGGRKSRKEKSKIIEGMSKKKNYRKIVWRYGYSSLRSQFGRVPSPSAPGSFVWSNAVMSSFFSHVFSL